VALKEIYEWFGSAVQASVEFESAMTGVAKTTDMSSEELAAMARGKSGFFRRKFPLLPLSLRGLPK